MTGPPPLDRNGGIWKSLKKNMSNVIETPNIMVQAFHFTTYNLSPKSWDSWMGHGPLSLERQIKSQFKRANVFVDSGGYQFMQGDKIDLSKWGLTADQRNIYNLQLKYSPTQICNLDYPILPRVDVETFKSQIDLNLKNIKELFDVSRNDKTKIYLVVHGRNSREIRYSYNAIKSLVDTSDDRIQFALGSQVPLMSSNKGLAVDNANSLMELLSEDFKNEKSLHLFGAGSQIIGNLKDTIDLSYDNSTFIRNAMYLKWYHPSEHIYAHFKISEISKCECNACSALNSYEDKSIVDVISGVKSDSLNKSDIMGLIALHNIYYEKDRVKSARRIDTNFPTNKIRMVKPVTKNYDFPFRGFKNNAPKLFLFPCSSKKPYSSSPSHIRIKTYLREQFDLKEFRDFETITLSGLFGPVHWKDEKKPVIISYDHRLTNMTSQDHVNYLKIRTATVMNVITKRYKSSFSVVHGLYRQVFGGVLKNYNVKIVEKAQDLRDL